MPLGGRPEQRAKAYSIGGVWMETNAQSAPVMPRFTRIADVRKWRSYGAAGITLTDDLGFGPG